MPVIQTTALTHKYGRHAALENVNLSVPEGSIFALLGPNGSGKTTLLQILMGLRRATSGSATVLGKEALRLTAKDRARVGYIAEGQPLPGWMALEELENYLAPLYDSWDFALAADLRQRFLLEPNRKLRTFSRGEQMKAALLCALAPRPQLLIMDEPFAGMDVLVRDELIQGLLQSAGSEGWSVLITSHDLSELETLADGVAFLNRGRLLLSESMDSMRERFRKFDVQAAETLDNIAIAEQQNWLALERSGARLSFVAAEGANGAIHDQIRCTLPMEVRIEQRQATLREVFLALSRANAPPVHTGIHYKLESRK